MKGIILAAGTGSRMYPITKGLNKHLLPVYDKPMIYYPLSVLMLAGIREILIITTAKDSESFASILGDGSDFGIQLTYQVQDKPKGIAEAFIIAESFIGKDKVCLALGDNIFFGQGFTPILKQAVSLKSGANLLGYTVKNPQDYGIANFDKHGRVCSLVEKPARPRSNCAITGLYFYDNQVVEMAKRVKPSKRGELEITSINKMYLSQNQLEVTVLGRGFAWLDTGTHSRLMEAGQFVQTIEKRQGLKIACLEEIGWRNGWLTQNQVIQLADQLGASSYADYLHDIIAREKNKLMNDSESLVNLELTA